MPELPEVETVVRQLRPEVEGRTIGSVPLASALMVRPNRRAFVRGVVGQTILRLDRQGKWMFFRLPAEQTLVMHLGMTGQLGMTPIKERRAPHTHLVLRWNTPHLTSNANQEHELRFVDPRRFGELLLMDRDSFDARFGPASLGPDALELTPERLLAIVSGTKRRIKVVLMDQRAVAGIGNIYADEILFDARIAPALAADQLDRAAVKRLHRSIGRVLTRAIAHQGTSIRDYVTAHGVPGEFQKLLRVYGRGGLPCSACQAPIVRSAVVLTGRTSYYCPICQPLSPIVENSGVGRTKERPRAVGRARKSGRSSWPDDGS